MCGIAGVINLSGADVSPERVDMMRDAISHRGPDDAGSLCDGPVGLANRRLSIIDLSPAGHQPMSSPDGDVHIAYNGEVYNFQELRAELEGLGHEFASRTDTEVVLHAYLEWGEKSLSRFDGMFAFCIWDSRSRRAFLARDRYGIKPLYYSYAPGSKFIFGSEIKAVLAEGSLERSVDHKALREYFTFQNVYSDRTLFKGIRLLPSGCHMWVDLDSGGLALARYWDFDFGAALAPGDVSMEECANRVRGLFESAVTRQLVSDVPLGSFLSGGMDSGSIVAVASRKIDRLMTFTGGFDLRNVEGLEAAFDEREAAESIASSFSTEHYEMVIHAGDMQWILPRLIWHLEDLRLGMCYQNFYMQRLASKFVKVVLSGAGGDEVFGGYPWRYDRLKSCSSDEEFIGGYFDYWQRLVPQAEHADFFNGRTMENSAGWEPAVVFKRVLEGGELDGFYGPEGSEAVPGGAVGAPYRQGRFLDAAMYFELKTFLHGLLVIADKLSMANSIEARVPYLDNGLVDFALTIPAEYKYAGAGISPKIDENVSGKKQVYYTQSSEGKKVLREAMAPLLPPGILERVKQGFSPPEGSWYRGPTMAYVRETILGGKSVSGEYFNGDYLKRIVEEHTAGVTNHRLLIWSLLSFEWWCRNWMK
jgi:asparagine synthase (glutamine-hydrolysing)